MESLLSLDWLSLITSELPQPILKVGTEGRWGGNVIIFVYIDGSCTSCDGCNNHAARKIEKKVIIRERLCFLLVEKVSEGFDLTLQVGFVVGVVQVIVPVCRTCVGLVLSVGVSNGCMKCVCWQLDSFSADIYFV